MAQTLVTGASGYVGSHLARRLAKAGHEVRAFARTPSKVDGGLPVVQGDVISGEGLDEALDGVDVAYYLIHSMEKASGANGGFGELEHRSAENFARAARAAGVQRVVYLGGPLPSGALSRHLGSRLAVEEVLLGAAPIAVAFRASILIGAGSIGFKLLVRLVERVPVLPVPAWGRYRSAPIDERDVFSYLLAAATSDKLDGPTSLDAAGPELLSYGEMVERIRDAMLLGRPRIDLPITMTPIVAKVASAIAGVDPAVMEPLMESLDGDLIPREDHADELLDVRLHSFDAAVEHALGEWERTEPLAGH